MKVRKCFNCNKILPNDNCVWIKCKEYARECDFLYYFDLGGNISSVGIEVKERSTKYTNDYVIYRYDSDYPDDCDKYLDDSRRFVFNLEHNELIDRIAFKYKFSTNRYNQYILPYSFTNNEDIVNKLKNYKKELLEIYELLIFS